MTEDETVLESEVPEVVEANVPDFTTAFMVVQDLRGQVHVVVDTPLDVLRAPTAVDLEMLASFVADSVRQDRIAARSAQASEPSVQDRLRARLQGDGR